MFQEGCNDDDALMMRGRAVMWQLLTHSLHLTYPLAGQRGCANVEESGLDVAGNGLANERFARPWGTKQEQALGGRSCALKAYRQCMRGSKRRNGGHLPACMRGRPRHCLLLTGRQWPADTQTRVGGSETDTSPLLLREPEASPQTLHQAVPCTWEEAVAGQWKGSRPRCQHVRYLPQAAHMCPAGSGSKVAVGVPV